MLGASEAVVRGKRRLDPTNVDDKETYEKQEQPEALAPLFEGSGGNYLSNEIFYRTSLRRSIKRPSLASGHLHIPPVGNEPQTLGPGLLKAVETALERFLKSRFRLGSTTYVAFQPTTVNTTSAPITLRATNDTSETIRVEKVEATTPFAVQSKETLPFSMLPGGTLTLTLTFTPTELRAYTGSLTVTAAGGEILLKDELTGQGVSFVPRITSFSPTSGRPGATVTIIGEHLDDAIDVRLGGISVRFHVFDPTRVTAEVTDDAQTGFIEVQTPNGTAISSTVFNVVRRFRPDLLAEHLRARRLALGLRQRGAAEAMGVRPGTYANWEQGRDEPRTQSFPAIIRFLGYDPSPEAQSLAERIRVARQREGISQRELAERLGVAASTVKAWEADTVRRPTPRVTRIFEDYVQET